MGILIGSTGFVGSHLSLKHDFDVRVHRSNVEVIQGEQTDLLVCAGLPAEKWKANQDPAGDWSNMAALAQVLSTVRADQAVLISTIDVYQPAIAVDETDSPTLNGSQAYGAHRAWFEAFFRSRFSSALVVRLPGLFAPDVRKNLVHDLLHRKPDQWQDVNPHSTFQFFDVRRTWDLVRHAWSRGIKTLNVSSEPVGAQEVADLFGVELHAQTGVVSYDMRSVHAPAFDGSGGYLFDRTEVLVGIARLREELNST